VFFVSQYETSFHIPVSKIISTVPEVQGENVLAGCGRDFVAKDFDRNLPCGGTHCQQLP
jgi:hypothetical protein